MGRGRGGGNELLWTQHKAPSFSVVLTAEQGRIAAVLMRDPSESCNLLLIQNLIILASALTGTWLIESALSYSWINEGH